MERYSWAVGIDEDTGLITVEDARLSLGALVTPAGAITSRSGLIPAAAVPGNVTATSPTPNGFVHVSPFRAIRQSTRGGGTYIQCLDEIKSLDVLTAAPADPAQDRIVLVVWQQNDTFFLDADSDFDVALVVGAPGSPPVDPTVTGSTEYEVRARVTVPANADEITNADIEVLPLPWTVAAGGVLPVLDVDERDDIVNPYDGLAVWRIDKGWIEVHDGAAYRVQGTQTVDALADITHPKTDQLALLSTDEMLYRWTGAAWLGTVYTAANGGHAKYKRTTPQSNAFVAVTWVKQAYDVAVNTSPDVAANGAFDVFTLQRAGTWEIDASSRANITNVAAMRYQLGIFPGATPGTDAYKVTTENDPAADTNSCNLSVSVRRRFALNDTICVASIRTGNGGGGGGNAADSEANATDEGWCQLDMRWVGP